MLRLANKLHFRTLRARMMTWFMVLSLTPVLLLVLIGLGHAQSRMVYEITTETEQDTLALARAIDRRVEHSLTAAQLFMRSNDVRQAFTAFDEAFEPDNLYSMAYQQAEDEYWPSLSFYSERQHLHDLLFINADGYVVFSSAQSDFYGQSVADLASVIPQLDSTIARVYSRMDAVFQLTQSELFPALLAMPVVYQQTIGVALWLPLADVFVADVLPNIGSERRVSVFTHIDGQLAVWPADRVQNESIVAIAQRAYRGRSLSLELTLDDGDWLVNARPLPAFEGVLVIRRDKQAALLPIQQLRWSALMGTAALVLLLSLLARQVSSGVTRPLNQLAKQLTRIRNGERQVQMDVQRRDELGSLARQFNQMAKSLRTTQSQLVQSEKMASIGHLAAGIAHEINNPMSIVTANFNMLKEYLQTYNTLADLLQKYLQARQANDDEKVQTLLAEIQALSQSQNLEYIVDDVNDIVSESSPGLERVRVIVESLQVFSELGRGEKQGIDFSLFIDHVISLLNIPSDAGVTIHKDIQLAKPVYVCEAEMRKVFVSILDNAVKACRGQGEVRIMARQKQGATLIECKDTGEGMDEKHVSRIFDPFYTTRPVGDGLGLGLSIAHAIVTAHGGNIWVVSQLGEGTRVRVSLPTGG